jgi:hypothetical protein
MTPAPTQPIATGEGRVTSPIAVELIVIISCSFPPSGENKENVQIF